MNTKDLEKLKTDGEGLEGAKKSENEGKIEAAKKSIEKAKEDLGKLSESVEANYQSALTESKRKELISEEDKEKAKGDEEADGEDIDSDTMKDEDGIQDPDSLAKELIDKSKKEYKDNPLADKKVTLRNMSDKDLGHLNNAVGKITHTFAENEREPEGDMPRRVGDDEIYQITFDKPKDPMYPTINVTKHFFKEVEKPKDKKTEESTSFRDKWTNAINGNS